MCVCVCVQEETWSEMLICYTIIFETWNGRLIVYGRASGRVFSSVSQYGFQTIVARLRLSVLLDDNWPIDLCDIIPNVVDNLHTSAVVQRVGVCFLNSFCLYKRLVATFLIPKAKKCN